MKLTVYTDTATDPASGRYACGLIVVDQTASRSIHQAGYLLDADAPGAAVYQAVIRAMGVIEPLGAVELDLRCGDQRIVNQITGVEPIDDAALEPLYEQVLAGLLRVDTWRIGVDRGEEHRAIHLANAALEAGDDVVDLDPETAGRQQKREHTGVPQWTVELLEEPGIDCPARCHMGIRYAFGPDVPGGFCVHAAKVALDDGPLTWPDPDQARMTTVCPLCDVPIQIQLVT